MQEQRFTELEERSRQAGLKDQFQKLEDETYTTANWKSTLANFCLLGQEIAVRRSARTFGRGRLVF